MQKSAARPLNAQPLPDAALLRRAAALAFVAASVFALMGASQSQAYYVLHPGNAPPWTQSLLWSAAQWYAWALFVPAIVAVAARFDLSAPARRPQRIALHAVCALAFALAHLLLQTALVLLLPGGRALFGSFGSGVLTLLATTLHWELLSYAIVVAAVHSVVSLRRAQAEALARRESEAHAAQAQLAALRRQMQPHFMFNALNALVAMQREDSAEQRYTIRLAELLRLLLEGGEKPSATLAEELRLVEAYLAVERARLGTRLRTCVDVPDALHDTVVPAFVLQPLVENAIVHGVAGHPLGGDIRVGATRGADAVTIEVVDVPRGAAASAGRRGTGVGLHNTRRRLELLFGAAARLDAAATPDGFRAAITVPAARA